MFRKYASCIALVALALTMIGCGGAESSVYGTVTLDGTSLESGTVTFIPTTEKGRSASGQIRSGGQYVVQAGQTGGLPSGEYAVTILSLGPSTPHPLGGPSTPGKLLTPNRYRDSYKSGFEFTVKPGSNRFDLELTSE